MPATSVDLLRDATVNAIVLPDASCVIDIAFSYSAALLIDVPSTAVDHATILEDATVTISYEGAIP